MTARRAIRRIAVLGAGPAPRPGGMELALIFRRAGFEVVLEDMLPGNLRRARTVLREDERAWEPEYAASIEDAVRTADMVFDTVPDELESKLEILSLADRMAPPAAVLVTPTELGIADLASCTLRPELCFAVRFDTALPPEEVTITRTQAADSATAAAVHEVFAALGMKVHQRTDEQGRG